MYIVRPDIESVPDETMAEWLRQGERAGFVAAAVTIRDADTPAEAFAKVLATGDILNGIMYKVTEVLPGETTQFIIEETIVEL